MCRYFPLLLGAIIILLSACQPSADLKTWQHPVRQQIQQLGNRNWIVIAEASFPAHNLPGITQVTAEDEIPEVVDFVFETLEATQNVRSKVFLTRELSSVENDYAPGIEEFREKLDTALHGHDPSYLDQQSLLTLLETANRKFTVLVIRTPTALPYSSVFFELQPGYWDAESEDHLREALRNRKAKLTPQQP